MSEFTKELTALAERLGKDGYPTALIERAASRTEAMEAEIVRLAKMLDNVTDVVGIRNKRIAELEGALHRIATRDYNETAQAFAEQALRGEDDE